MIINRDIYTIKDEDLGLKVDLFGHESRVRSHSHDFIEFTLVEQGFTMHRAEGEKTSLLLPGDLLFILPGTAHEYWRSTNNKVFNCLFYSNVLGEDYSSLAQLPLLNQVLHNEPTQKLGLIHLKPELRYAVIEIFKKIMAEGSLRQIGWIIRSKALLMDFLVIISRGWSKEETGINQENVSILDELKSSKEALNYTPYAMIEILEKSQSNRTSVETMAAAMGYSPEHFSRMFKKLTGISPTAYQTGMRIAAAAEKLMDEKLSITEVAQLTGFEDVNYFSRIFKKETGKTPSQFRSYY